MEFFQWNVSVSAWNVEKFKEKGWDYKYIHELFGLCGLRLCNVIWTKGISHVIEMKSLYISNTNSSESLSIASW